MFSRHTRFEVGDAQILFFGMMCDVRITPLKETFPELFSIASSRNVSMVDHLIFSNCSPQWTFKFARVAHDRELESFSLFFDKLYFIRLR